MFDWVALLNAGLVGRLLDCWCGSGEIDFKELRKMMEKIKKQMLPSSLDAYMARGGVHKAG